MFMYNSAIVILQQEFYKLPGMRKAFYIFLTATLGLFNTSLSVAQREPIYQPIGSGTDGDYKISAKEPLNVLLPEPMSKERIDRNYKKPADQAEYFTEVAAKRNALQTAAASWHLSPVKFITEADYTKLKLDKKDKHLVLSFGTRVYVHTEHNTYIPDLELCLVGKVGGHEGVIIKRDYNWQILAYQLFNPYTKLFLVGRGAFWHKAFTTSDVISTVQQLQAYFEQRTKGVQPRDINKAAEARVGQNAELLKRKTLLVAKERVSGSLPESKIQQFYPYPVQLTDQATLDAAVASADSRYLYLHFVTANGNNGFQLLDAASGQLISYADFHSVEPEDFGKLQDVHLKEIVKLTAKK